MAWKPLPVGVDDFEKLVSGNYFYIDKTLFIKELIEKKGEVICLPVRGDSARR